MDQETGFCRPYRSPGWSSWLPTSILSNPDHCGHLGSEPADSMWSLSQISNFNVTYWMSVKAGVVHMKRRGWKQELTPNQQDISGIRENLSSIYPQCSRLFLELWGNAHLLPAPLVSNLILGQSLSLGALYFKAHKEPGLMNSWVTC